MTKFSDYEQTAKEYNIGGGADFWKPEKGENRVRILTGYEAYGTHFIKKDNRSYTCIGAEKNCPHCLNNDKPKVLFLMWVLNRADDTIKLAQIGYSIVRSIGELSKSDDWKFDEIPEYDIVINRTGEGLKTEYSVIPTPDKTPLTEEQKGEVENKVKSIKEIIDKMKEKVINELNENAPALDELEDVKDGDITSDDIKVENIPF